MDNRQSVLTHLRSWAGILATPIYWVSDVPIKTIALFREAMTSHEGLLEENTKLKARNLILTQKLQKYAALTVQNQQLRELLNSSRPVEERVVVAELIGVNPNPLIKQVTINKGIKNGVYIGQPVLDASGIMGQVIAASFFTSTVSLITDENNRVPVQVNRNGYRAIAAGKGDNESIEILYVPHTADIRKGDLLISSGLGQRYPFGYPVAVVSKIKRDPGLPFVTITAEPLARLNRSRLVMLIFVEEKRSA